MVILHSLILTDICKCEIIETKANIQVNESQKWTNSVIYLADKFCQNPHNYLEEQIPCQEHSRVQDFIKNEKN